jgi:hypothetical protein
VKANPGIICDNCGDPCRHHYIAGQCPECGGYICKGCLQNHLCMSRSKQEVDKMLPEYVDYGTNVNKIVVNPSIH